MKKLLFSILVLIPLIAGAHHPGPEEGKVYQLPATSLCKSPEVVAQFQELYMKEGKEIAQQYVLSLIRTKECRLTRGGSAKYLDTVQTWKYEGYVFRLLKIEINEGEVYYTVFGWKNHDAEA